MTRSQAMLTPMLVLPLLLAGCNRDAIDFNNQIASLHDEIGQAAKALGGKLESPDVAAAYNDLLHKVRAVRAKSDSMTLPDVAGAEALYHAHRRFLSFQEALVQDDLAEVVDLATEAARSPDERQRQQLHARMRSIRDKERRALESLRAAQKAFAEANGLRLSP